MLHLAPLEENGLAYVAQLVRQGSFVPDSILIPAQAGKWADAQAALTRWRLSDIADELSADVVENMSEFGGWSATWGAADVREYLDSAWADNALYADLTNDERAAVVPIVEAKARRALASHA